MEQPECTKPPRKKLAEMTPEQRREYNAQSRRKSREKEKQERLARLVPTYADFRLPDTQREQLAEHSRHMIESIAAELSSTLTFEDECILSVMANVVLGYEKDLTQQVHSPFGVLYGGYYPDAAASDILAHVHQFPGLLASQTFADMYQKFLKTVHKLSRNSWFDPNFAKQIESELDGTYSLPPEPRIPVAPEPKPEPPMPNEREIFEHGRVRLLERLYPQDPNIPAEARQYLEGI